MLHIPWHHMSVVLALSAALGLAACSTPTEACDLESYRSLLGQSIAAVTLPSDPKLRVIMPDDVVTMEFVADRINIHVDDQGRIDDLTCG